MRQPWTNASIPTKPPKHSRLHGQPTVSTSPPGINIASFASPVILFLDPSDDVVSILFHQQPGPLAHAEGMLVRHIGTFLVAHGAVDQLAILLVITVNGDGGSWWLLFLLGEQLVTQGTRRWWVALELLNRDVFGDWEQVPRDDVEGHTLSSHEVVERVADVLHPDAECDGYLVQVSFVLVITSNQLFEIFDHVMVGVPESLITELRRPDVCSWRSVIRINADAKSMPFHIKCCWRVKHGHKGLTNKISKLHRDSLNCPC